MCLGVAVKGESPNMVMAGLFKVDLSITTFELYSQTMFPLLPRLLYFPDGVSELNNYRHNY